MASKKGDCAGSVSGSRSVGKAGKVRVEGRQSRLATEEKDGGKRVTFKLEERKEETDKQEGGSEGVTDIRAMINQIVRREIKENLKEQEDRLRKEIEELKTDVRKGEERVEGLRKEEGRWEEKWEEIRERFDKLEKDLFERMEKRVEEIWREQVREGEEVVSEARAGEGSGNESERGLSWSKGSRNYGSTTTMWSEDRLSSREVDKIRKWVNEKERMDRKENIVLRGVVMPSEIEKEKDRGRDWIKELIKNKLGVECEVKEVRRSGPVIVARIEGEEGKKEIMRNKFKLKGERIFIENDLTYEERKVQERMGRWAREKRVGGVEVKVGRGRVKIGNRWITWEEIEREERGREEEGRGEKEGEGRENRNFV